MNHPIEFRLERLMTPTGEVLLVSDGAGNLRAMDWVDCEARMRRLLRIHYGAGVILIDLQNPSEIKVAVETYFEGNLAAIDELPVVTAGTDFQRKVWAILRTIPAGQTTSYGAIAARIARPKAVRAVGLANGSNPVPIVVPW